jgi:hypothetical protein
LKKRKLEDIVLIVIEQGVDQKVLERNVEGAEVYLYIATIQERVDPDNIGIEKEELLLLLVNLMSHIEEGPMNEGM